MYVNDKRTPGLKARSKALAAAKANEQAQKEVERRAAMRAIAGK